MSEQLSKLQKVDLREVWKDEARDFTPWLALPENLAILGEAIGVVDIRSIRTEAGVGEFSVDILAEEEGSNKKIIIENQLERTNHKHLGQIITYAAGKDAKIIVWVVKEVQEDHQRAVEWLNEHIDESIGFFLVRIELWKIDNSKPAPQFDIVVSPNEWAKAAKDNVDLENEAYSETKLQQLDFWGEFKEYVARKDNTIRLRKPHPQHWYDVSIGISGVHISWTLHKRENWIGCGIYISKNKKLFYFLQTRKEEIEKIIGEKAEWIDAKIDSRVIIKNAVIDVFDQANSEQYFEWLYQKMILLKSAFIRHIDEFKINDSEFVDSK